MIVNTFEDEVYMYVIGEQVDIRENQGRKGLLPQNLPSEILFILYSHAIDFLSEDIESMILYDCTTDLLLSDSQRENAVDWPFTQDRHSDCTEMYSIAIQNEYLRRIKRIHIPKDKLPTVKSIFQRNRDLCITTNDKDEFREYNILER